MFAESFSERIVPTQEENPLSGGQTDSENQIEQSSDLDSEAANKYDNATQSSDDKRSAGPSIVEQSARESSYISCESDLVSSTNKEDDECSSQPTQSQDAVEHKEESDPSFASDERSESTAYEGSEDVNYSQSEQTDSKSESTFVTPDASEENNVHNELTTSDDYDPDDGDDVRERRNPRLCSERELPQQFDDNSKPKNYSQNFQRNRHTRPQLPRPNHPYGGPDFNPQFMPQFRGARRPMPPGSQPDFMRGHNMGMMRGPPNHMQRMPPGMPPHPSRMPMGPNMLGPPHLMQRPFQPSSAMFGNNPGMPPQGRYTIFASFFCIPNL